MDRSVRNLSFLFKYFTKSIQYIVTTGTNWLNKKKTQQKENRKLKKYKEKQ